MAWWIPLAAGAGVGLLQNELVDKPQEAEERKMQALIASYSPYTGMQAKGVKGVSPWSRILQGGASGLSMGQELGGKYSLYGSQGKMDQMLGRKKLLQAGYTEKDLEEAGL